MERSSTRPVLPTILAIFLGFSLFLSTGVPVLAQHQLEKVKDVEAKNPPQKLQPVAEKAAPKVETQKAEGPNHRSANKILSPKYNASAFLPPPKQEQSWLAVESQMKKLGSIPDSVRGMEKRFREVPWAANPKGPWQGVPDAIISRQYRLSPSVINRFGTWNTRPSLQDEFQAKDGHFRIPRVHMAGVVYGSIGGSLAGLGQFQEAEEELLKAYSTRVNTRGIQDPLTVQTVEALIQLYQKWGKEKVAQKYQQLISTE